MQNSFPQLIEGAKSILIVLPKNPFFDQVAAALGLFLALKNNKDTAITCVSPMVVEFNRLVGVDKVTSEIGNKNLVIRFSNYQATDIERVSYDIEGSEFKLSVIPKPQIAPPKEDQVVVSYSGLSVDTVILVGGVNESHFPMLSGKDFERAKIAHVGIQSMQAEAKAISSFATQSSSVSEIVANLLQSANIPLDQDIATNLLAGIYDGTKNFTSNFVTENTFKVAATLKAVGGSQPKEKLDSKNFPQGSIPQVQPAPAVVEAPVAAQPAIAVPAITEPKPIEPIQTAPPKSWLEPKILKSTTTD